MSTHTHMHASLDFADSLQTTGGICTRDMLNYLFYSHKLHTLHTCIYQSCTVCKSLLINFNLYKLIFLYDIPPHYAHTSCKTFVCLILISYSIIKVFNHLQIFIQLWLRCSLGKSDKYMLYSICCIRLSKTTILPFSYSLTLLSKQVYNIYETILNQSYDSLI